MAGGKNAAGDLGLLVLRLALGGIFIAHGVEKLVPPNSLEGFADGLGLLGIPSPYAAAVAVISAEIGGGLLVVLGLFARVGALSLACVMAGAIAKVHWVNGFWLPLEMKEPGRIPMGIEYNVALLAMALCVVLVGAGSMCLFPALGKKSSKSGKP